jgi:hypothetical protein
VSDKRTDSKGRYKATLPLVVDALKAQTKYRLGLWKDRAAPFVAIGTEDWRPLTHTDLINLRTMFERELNFAPVGRNVMDDAALLVASYTRIGEGDA